MKIPYCIIPCYVFFVVIICYLTALEATLDLCQNVKSFYLFYLPTIEIDDCFTIALVKKIFNKMFQLFKPLMYNVPKWSDTF